MYITQPVLKKTMANFNFDSIRFLGKGYFAHAYLLDDGNVIKVGQFGENELAALQALAGTGLAPEYIFKGKTTHEDRGRCEYLIMSAAAGVLMSSIYEEEDDMTDELCVAYGQGLRALHAAGWVHGDPHPGNTFVQVVNGVMTVTFIDLGLAEPYSAELAENKDLRESYHTIWSNRYNYRRIMNAYYNV